MKIKYLFIIFIITALVSCDSKPNVSITHLHNTVKEKIIEKNKSIEELLQNISITNKMNPDLFKEIGSIE